MDSKDSMFLASTGASNVDSVLKLFSAFSLNEHVGNSLLVDCSFSFALRSSVVCFFHEFTFKETCYFPTHAVL